MAKPGEPGRRAKDLEGRVAVVDIGSNSIRLVVFDGLKRAFLPLFNEKVICGLGRGLGTSGRLSEEGVDSALVNLTRFVAMARAMKIAELHMIATAAVREARNGLEFANMVEGRCGHPIRVLSGFEEARLAALGVLAGLPAADGIMGDLGGGSLELVSLDRGQLGSSKTLPLGALRHADALKCRHKQALKLIDRELDKAAWLGDVEGRDLYAVGGAWRNLARLHMEQIGHPLHVLHGYALPRGEAADLARLVAGLGKRSIAHIPGISRRRAETLPYAALLLERLLLRCRPSRLVLSAYGLREGLLFDRLTVEQRVRDPLIDAAAQLALAQGRFGNFSDALACWTDPLFPEEPQAMRRLREAACLLSDVAWREHPDYRAKHALGHLLHFPFMAVDHRDRAFIAVAVATRYAGCDLPPAADAVLSLLSPAERRRAQVTGLALRLAYSLSAGVPALLQKVSLRNRQGRLTLDLPRDGSIPPGEIVERRLQALVQASEAKSGHVLA